MTKATLAVVVGLKVRVQYATINGSTFADGIVVDLNSVGITLKSANDHLIFVPMHRVIIVYGNDD
jgi:hypothetical protein